MWSLLYGNGICRESGGLIGLNVIITKASGEKEAFSKRKLRQSLLQAGASEAVAKQIVQEIEKTLTEGLSTKIIYKKAHKLLSKAARPIAGRYHLKKCNNGTGAFGVSV